MLEASGEAYVALVVGSPLEVRDSVRWTRWRRPTRSPRSTTLCWTSTTTAESSDCGSPAQRTRSSRLPYCRQLNAETRKTSGVPDRASRAPLRFAQCASARPLKSAGPSRRRVPMQPACRGRAGRMATGSHRKLLVGTNGGWCRRPLLLHDWSRLRATAGRRPPRAGTDDEKQSDPCRPSASEANSARVEWLRAVACPLMQPTYTRAHERRSRRRHRSRAGAGARHCRWRDNRSASCTRGRGRARCAAWLALAPEAHVARARNEVFTRSGRQVGV